MLHARSPMVTPDERRAIQEANVEGDERFWGAMRDMGTASIEGHKALISSVETKIAEQAPRVAEAGKELKPPRIALKGSRAAQASVAGLASRSTFAPRLRQRASPSATCAECGCWPA